MVGEHFGGGTSVAEEDRMGARLWKVGVRRGMAYVEGKVEAERVLCAAGLETLTLAVPVSSAHVAKGTVGVAGKRKHEELLPGAMAVYSDRKGRAFAWQICFDLRDWEAVANAAGIAVAARVN